MAIYSLHAKYFSRAKGQSSVAAAAYRHGVSLTDERTSITHDYSKRSDAIFSELSLPENSPLWMSELKQLSQKNYADATSRLWNLVEKTENRKDSELAREIRIALPIELSALQNIELVRDFVKTMFSDAGIVSDWAIHFDAGNPHVHIMNSTRSLEDDGFGKKVELWKSKVFLQKIRVAWEVSANHHLKINGIDACIDHRSNKERGIDFVPTKHMGKALTEMQRRGEELERFWGQRDIQRENLSRIKENPAILFDAVSKETSTFSTEKVAQTLARYVNPHDGEFSVFTPEFLDLKKDDIAVIFKPFEPLIRENVLTNMANDAIEESVKENINKPLTSFKQILANIEKHESVFSEQDVAREVFKLTPDAELFAQTLAAVKNELHQNNHVLSLGLGDDGRERFTTRHFFNLENKAINLSIKQGNQKQFSVSACHIEKALAMREAQTGKTLTREQQDALRHLTQSSGLSCMVGRAGTGKSFTIGTVKMAYELAGFNVQGVALSGVASDGLSRDANIPSRTIDSFLLALEHNPTLLNEKTVLIMDEAGMTDSVSMLSILKAVRSAKSKLILLGDPDQLQPVGPGALFRGILERLGYIEIQEIYRQEEIWQKEATKAFACGDVTDALTAYEERGFVHLEKTDNDAMNKLVADWKQLFLEKNNLAQQLVITYRNQDVQQLNTLIRQTLVENGALSEGYALQTKSGVKHIAKGERLLFLENNHKLGVKNGRFATVTKVDFLESGRVRSFNVILDGHDKEITIDPKKYNHVDYGYAATVHKTQGVTIDNTFVYVTKDIWNRALAYVAMTRHRLNAHLYASKESFLSMDLLKRSLQKLNIKDSVIDFPLAFARRRGIEPNTQGLHHHLAKKLRDVAEKFIERYQQWRDPVDYAATQKQEQALIAREQLRQDAQIVARYADLHREVGQQWQRIQATLKSEGVSLNHPDFEKSLKALPEYQAMLDKRCLRDALAADIHAKSEYYAKAIELNRLNVHVLAKHSATHVVREKINSYQLALKNNATLLAQKIAFTLRPEIKISYALLKGMNVDAAQLNSQASHYHQRLAKASLTRAEREAFDRVACYQALLKQSASLLSKLNEYYQAEKHPEACVVLTEKLTQLGKQKSQMAAQILKNRDHHAAGLDYFEIGKGIDMNRAQKRWFQLQQAASFHRFHQQQPTVAISREKTESVVASIPLKSTSHFIDLARLKSDLNESVEAVAMHYLGQPKKQAHGQLRYGDNKGSLLVTLTGNKQGCWYDFQTAEGGDMLSLISHTTGKNFKNTLREAIQFLGGESRYLTSEANYTAEKIAARTRQQQATTTREAIAQAKKLKHVQDIANGAQPIQGTLASRYLREHRGITQELNSDNLRFHPALKNWVTGDVLPALVILAHDEKNQLSGVQATFLDPLTANKASLDSATKLSRGTISQGSVVHVAVSPTNVNTRPPVIALAEGLESALSVAEAHPDWQVNVTFGVSNFERVATHVAQCSQGGEKENLRKPLYSNDVNVVANVAGVAPQKNYIIICADNDGIDSGTDKTVKKAMANLNAKGIDVFVVEPTKPEHFQKYDFNDVLKYDGVEAVCADLNSVIIPSSTTQEIQIIANETNAPEKTLIEKLIEYIDMGLVCT